jgi:hypothetical protein
VVAVVGDQFRSIFDGRTEYRIGVPMFQDISGSETAGFFVHRTGACRGIVCV